MKKNRYLLAFSNKALFSFTALFFFYFFCNNILVAQCPPGNVILNSQADVDDYVANYPNCATISGYLRIGPFAGSSDITDVSGLSSITSVTGFVSIQNSPNLSSIDGLNGLSSAGAISIYNCDALTTLGTAFQGVTSLVSYLNIENCAQLSDISGLQNITDVGGELYIKNNGALSSLSSLNGVVSIGDDLRITGNTGLTELNDFNNLTTVNGWIQIEQNSALNTISGFGNLSTVDGSSSVSISIIGNSGLTSISGFGGIGTFDKDVIIRTNSSLTDISGFNSLTFIGGGTILTDALIIQNNDALINITGFQMLNTCEALIIKDNAQLADINNFGTITTLWQEFTISNNASIQQVSIPNNNGSTPSEINNITIGNNDNLTAINGSTNISQSGDVVIANNPLLSDLSGFSGISSVSDNLTIDNNPNLTTLSGLSDITFVGDKLKIVSNGGLVDLTGLTNLQNVTDLWVEGNNSLQSLNGLNNFTQINNNGELHLEANPALSNINSLANISFGFNASLFIQDNTLLSVCDIQSICSFLNSGGTATISNNKVGCNSVQQVEDSCNDICTWICGSSGNWNDPNCWSCGVVPTPIDTVKINQSNIVTVNSSSSAFELDLNGGTITGASTLSVTGDMDWSAGTLNVPTTVTGTLTLQDTGQKDLGAALTLNGNTTHSDGTFSVNAGGSVVNGATYTFSGGGIALGGSAVFTNNATFTTSLDATISGSCTEKFLNSATGTVTKSGGAGTLTFSPEFENLGTVNLNSGNLSLACLDWQGGLLATTSPLPPTVFVGSGTVAAALNLSSDFVMEKNTSGTLSVNAPFTVSGNFMLSNGTLNGSSTLTIANPAGAMQWTGGTLGVPTTIDADAILDLTGAATKTLAAALTLDGSFILEEGTFTRSGSETLTVPNGMFWDGGTLNVPTTIQNGATLDLNGGLGTMTLTSTLTNNGDAELAGGLSIEDVGSFVNGNSFILSGGSLTLFYGGVFLNNGTFNVQIDGSIFGGTGEKFTNSATGTFTRSAGTGDFNLTTEFENLGTVNLNSGALDFSFLDWQGGTFSGTAGTTCKVDAGTVSGALTIPANVAFQKNNSGTLTVSAALALNGNTTHAAGTLSVAAGGGVTNGGTYAFSGGGLTLASGTTFTNSLGAAFNWSFAATVSGAGATFDNDGTFATLTGSSFTIEPDLDNSGTINLNGTAPAQVNLSGILTQSGTINIGNDASVSLTGGGTASAPFSFGSFSSLSVDGSTLNMNTAQTVPAGASFVVSAGTLTGTGNLSVSGTMLFNGGTLDLPTTVNALGTIDFTAFMSASSLTEQVAIAANGTGRMVDGTLQVGTGGSIQNSGTFDWQGGTVDLAAGTTFDNVGTLTMSVFAPPPPIPPPPPFSGNFTGSGIFNNSGTFQNNLTAPPTGFSFGPAFINTGILTQPDGQTKMDFAGLMENQTGGQVMGNGIFNFNGGLVNDGSFAPGNSPGFLTVSTFENSGSTLNIEILDDNSYDILDVQGPATLDGTLNVTLLGGNPTAGTDFAIVMATGGLGGTQFSTVNFPAPASDWSITYNTNDVVISYQTALPVELIDFKVFKEKTHILLEWRTASETNNRGFEIQSSVGSLQSTVRNWKTLGFVAGQGNSAGQHDYQFLDKNPQPGINYYRLRQMDFDGRFSFSKIISVEWDGADGNGFSVFPNPVSRGVLYLEMPFQNEKEWELTLINAIGQTVRQASFQNVETSVYEWKIPDLPTGVYWLQMQDGQRSWAQRVVVK